MDPIHLPRLYSCGSNGSAQLAIGHSDDVSTFTKVEYHPSFYSHLESLTASIPVSTAQTSSQHRDPPDVGVTVIDLISSSAHSLLLLELTFSPSSQAPTYNSATPYRKRILLGAGTNTHGQLGPKCALWDKEEKEGRFKVLDILHRVEGAGEDGREGWEVCKIAACWTTSFILFRRSSPYLSEAGESGSSAAQGGSAEDNDGEEEYMLVSMGSNDFSELGSSAPSDASQNPRIVDLGLERGEWVEHMKAGQRHVVVVISSGRGRGRKQRVVGWGAGRKGELDGSTAVLSGGSGAGSDNGSVRRREGEMIEGKGKGKGKAAARPSTMPPTIIDLPIPSQTAIEQLSLGSSHSVALLSDGRCLAWGSNLKNQLAISNLPRVVQEGTSWGGSYFLAPKSAVYMSTEGDGDDQGEQRMEIWSVGSNTHSQLLRGPSSQNEELGRAHLDDTPRQLTVGSEHVMVICRSSAVKEDKLYVGGWNEHGNLGLGDQIDRPQLTPVDLSSIYAGPPGKIEGCWAGCAASWIWVE